MMQAYKLKEHLLFCHEEDRNLLHLDNVALQQLRRIEGVNVFKLKYNGHRISYCFDITQNKNLHRYLDRFYLYTPEESPTKRQQVLDVFFEFISEEYDSLIDVGRNIDNIRNLIDFIRGQIDIKENITLIDYGCGTGLSSRVLMHQKIKIVGIDRCPKMRQIATKRGMQVLSPDELAYQQKDSFGGAFASYVLHLLPHVPEIRFLWASLKQKGIFVANFHKNQGVELMNKHILELGGTIQHLKSPPMSEKHGLYVAYYKK